jgi:hypothetical protein
MEFSEGLARLEGRARLATIMLWVFVAFGTLTAGGEALEAAGVVNIEVDTSPLSMAVALVYLGFMVIFIACLVVVARWIHRGHANLHEAGVDGLEFTPGWAIGWYFIPIANLFKPFQAMRELWNASHAEHDQFAAQAPPEVKSWWAAWIVGNILSSVGTRILTMGEGGASSVTIGNAVGAAGSLVTVLAAVLLIKVIDGVTQAQRGGSTAAGVFA